MTEAPPSAAAPHRTLRRQAICPLVDLHVRTVRPSLLDPRFTGDPWIVQRPDGTLRLCLGDYGLTGIFAAPLDVPGLNGLFQNLRHCRGRRR